MKDIIGRLEEASGEWGVMWTEFSRSDRLVKKKKFFDSEAKRDVFAKKVENNDNFNKFSGWSKPTEKAESMDAVQENVGEAEEFAGLLRKKYRGVKFDAKRQTGTLKMGRFTITWSESQNDPAVRVSIVAVDGLKGSPENVMDALNHMAKSWMRV